MKKRKLEAEFEYDFSLFGIISVLKEYKLAWLLNNILDVQLDKANDIEIEFLKSQNLIISNYLVETENSSLRLLKNKSMDQFNDNPAYLLPELKRFDYFMIIQGFEDTFSNQVLKQKISSIPGIQYVQFFSLESLKSRENLIF
jgi:hypothetical protein